MNSTLTLLILLLITLIVLSTVFILYWKQWITRKRLLAISLAGIFIGSGMIVIMSQPPASSTSETFPSSADEVNGLGTRAWTGETNILVDDSSWATSLLTVGSSSEFLHAYNYGFSSVIGAMDDIDGVTVKINRKASAVSSLTDAYLYLVDSSNVSAGPDKADIVTTWPTTAAGVVATYTWTEAELEDAGIDATDVRHAAFGVYLSVYNAAEVSRTASVDYITITVSYTAGAWTNTEPSFSSPAPTNASTGISLYPKTNITISDSDTNQTLTVCFYENHTVPGTWTLVQKNVTSPTRTSPYTYRDMSASYVSHYLTTFWWRVTANDGLVNKSAIYHFTTAVSNFEYDAMDGRTPDMVRVNNSEFYLIAASGGSNGYKGMLYTLRVWGNNGSIQQSNVSYYNFDTSTAWIYPKICQISGTNKYTVAYVDNANTPTTTDDLVKVFTVNVSASTGAITNSKAGSLTISNASTYPSGTPNTDIKYLSNGICSITYSSSSYLYMKTIHVNSSTGAIWGTVNDTQIVNASGVYGRLEKIDNDTLAVAYTDSVSEDGYLKTFNISSTGQITNTPSDEYEFATSYGGKPSILFIANDVYALSFLGSNPTSKDMYVRTVRINTTGFIIPRYIDALVVDTGTCEYPYLYHISENDYALTYQGTDSDGYISLFTINYTGFISDSVVSTVEFNTTDDRWYAPLAWVAGDYYLLVFAGTNSGTGPADSYDGLAYVWDISTLYTAPSVQDTTPKNNSDNLPLSFNWSCYITNRNSTFDYTIKCSHGETTSGTGVSDGVKFLVVSGLSYDTLYTVWVNSTEGSTTIHNVYYFTTVPLANATLLNLINQGKSIMFIEAHPDDEGYIIPGVIEYAHSRGNDVYILCVKSIAQTSSPDEVEVYNSWLNSSFLTWFHYMGINVDSWGAAEKQDAEDKILENITLYDPDIVITYSPYGYVDNAGQSAHQNVSSIVSQAYANITGGKPYLYWGIDTGQDLGADVEYTLYPPTDIVSFDMHSNDLSKSNWDDKVDIWSQLSFVIPAFNTQLRDSTWYDENDRCEYFYMQEEGGTTYTDEIRNYGTDYMVWLGVNTTASVVKTKITGFNEATEHISIWKNTTWTTSNGLWMKYNGTGTGTNWDVHTFDIIRTYLDDAVGNQTITMTGNPDVNYTNTKAITLVKTATNKGYNFSAYNRLASTTLSTISTTNIGLTSGDFVARWNRTLFAWDIYISGFGPHTHAVYQWDVIQTKVSNTETWNT